MCEISQMKKVFFIGIGGIGMSAIAVILKNRGVEVIGSDRAASETTANLIKQGIDVCIGHKAENIKPDFDAVVYTNAIPSDNPEYLKAVELGINVMERARMLDIIASNKFSIGISGTHGKTTTTSMVSKILLRSGFDPSLAVGGYLNEIKGSGYDGSGKYFVYEACEAYGSFLKLHPNISIITNIDSDHLDYYGNINNIKKAFREFISHNIPSYGMLVYNNDNPPLRKVVRSVKNIRSVSVGIKKTMSDFSARLIKLDAFSSEFTAYNKKELIGSFSVNVPGIHNVYNALLAIAACTISGVPLPVIKSTLENFKNANRRFQLKYQDSTLMVIDDYAHHPSEIDATLNAARNLSNINSAQLIAIFQPHLYSRTEFLYKDFARSLSKADRVILTDIYAAREINEHNISSKIIFDEIVKIKGNKSVVYTKELVDIPAKVKTLLNGNNIVVTLGAGDVWKVSDMLNKNH